LERGQSVVALVAPSESRPKTEKNAVILIMKDGRVRLKVDMDDHMGGHLWTWVDETDIKEVLTNVPKIPEEELLL